MLGARQSTAATLCQRTYMAPVRKPNGEHCDLAFMPIFAWATAQMNMTEQRNHREIQTNAICFLSSFSFFLPRVFCMPEFSLSHFFYPVFCFCQLFFFYPNLTSHAFFTDSDQPLNRRLIWLHCFVDYFLFFSYSIHNLCFEPMVEHLSPIRLIVKRFFGNFVVSEALYRNYFVFLFHLISNNEII